MNRPTDETTENCLPPLLLATTPLCVIDKAKIRTVTDLSMKKALVEAVLEACWYQSALKIMPTHTNTSMSDRHQSYAAARQI